MSLQTTWHIIGAGSLGLLWAYHLRQAGFRIQVLMRNQQALKSFRSTGSCIHMLEEWRTKASDNAWQASIPMQAAIVDMPNNHLQPRNINNVPPFSGSAEIGPIRNLVLATKAQDATSALRSVLPYMATGCRCILLQNGVLAVADELQRELGLRVGRASTGIGQEQLTDTQNCTSTNSVFEGSSHKLIFDKSLRMFVASVTHGCYRQAPPISSISPPGPKPSATEPPVSASPNPSALGVVHAGRGHITLGPVAPLLISLHSQGPNPPPPPTTRPNPHTITTTGAQHSASPPPYNPADGPPPMEAHFSHSFYANTDDGDDHDDARFLQQLAAAVPGLVIRPAPDPKSLLRELHAKLAANCAINPLTALLSCRNGVLAEHDHTRELMRAVCRELVTVFGPQAFHNPTCEAEAGAAATRRTGRDEAAAAVAGEGKAGACDSGSEVERALYEWVLGVVAATARNRSSMLQDISAGRRTEVDYLSGWVLRRAAARGLEAPVNGTLYNMVKAKEAVGAGLEASV